MQSIGERLEEARKRKGISLREAAEATKIRGDFLSNFEQNRFDFDLPEIYKRGFVRNYATYLKLDGDSLLNDYNAQLLGNARAGRRSAGTEWFGRIDPPAPRDAAGEAEAPAPMARAKTPVAAPAAPDEPQERERPPRTREPLLPGDIDRTVYIKVGLVLAGTAALVVILIALVSAILGGSPDPEPAVPATPPEQVGGGGGAPAATASTLTLEATGTTYVNVRRSADRSEIFKGTLAAGDIRSLEKLGPVDIVWTKGENLRITVDGEAIQTQPGTAKINIP